MLRRRGEAVQSAFMTVLAIPSVLNHPTQCGSAGLHFPSYECWVYPKDSQFKHPKLAKSSQRVTVYTGGASVMLPAADLAVEP